MTNNVIVFDEEEFKKFVAKCSYHLNYSSNERCLRAYDDASFGANDPKIHPITIIDKEEFKTKMEIKKR